MSQKSIDSYFNTRKRLGNDDLKNVHKKICLEKEYENAVKAAAPTTTTIAIAKETTSSNIGEASTNVANSIKKQLNFDNNDNKIRKYTVHNQRKHLELSNKADDIKKTDATPTQRPLVTFIKAGPITPKKNKATIINNNDNAINLSSNTTTIELESNQLTKLLESKESQQNVETVIHKNYNIMKTPSKEEQLVKITAEKQLAKRLNMPFKEIKSKIRKSSKLNDLKLSLDKLKKLETQRQDIRNKNAETLNNNLSTPADTTVATNNNEDVVTKSRLKKFEKIYLEVLTSPTKGYKTPIKQQQTDVDLMLPREITPRKLFSPTKLLTTSPHASPIKAPAYQRYQHLIEDTSQTTTTLQLPYKYRLLLEIFKAIDSVCSMYFNRCETITFKKLKTAVQRMIRKNFTEIHLAQIKYIFPDAFKLHQKKILNPGSLTKYDYYQLIVTPNVNRKKSTTITNEIVTPSTPTTITTISTETNVKSKTLNKSPKLLNLDDNLLREAEKQVMHPSMIIERQKYFYNILLNLVKNEHDKFLQSLTPPMTIDKNKIKRWHPEFNLDLCPDIEQYDLPKPPNVEQFSSAKHVLATATKNLFGYVNRNDCNTSTSTLTPSLSGSFAFSPSTPGIINDDNAETNDCISNVLKNVPKSLLAKIRAKQTAQAIDSMTRRPSQDQSDINYNYLPELARHIRNIFVTENKNVLELHKVITKITNSYRANLSIDKIKELIKLISCEAPKNWLTLHVIRKNEFLKINKSIELSEILLELERKVKLKRTTNIYNDFLNILK